MFRSGCSIPEIAPFLDALDFKGFCPEIRLISLLRQPGLHARWQASAAATIR
jgi:hypothetical protein